MRLNRSGQRSSVLIGVLAFLISNGNPVHANTPPGSPGQTFPSLAWARADFSAPTQSDDNFSVTPDNSNISYDGSTNSYFYQCSVVTINTNASWNNSFAFVATNNYPAGSGTAAVFLASSMSATGGCSNIPVHARADSTVTFLGGTATGDCETGGQLGYGNSASGYQSSTMIMPGQSFEFDGNADGAAAAYNY